MLTMMADNIEHVISYWVVFQKFHSAALGGFAVVSHWLPFLVFSVPVGALNDRFDSRRLIQIGDGALHRWCRSAGATSSSPTRCRCGTRWCCSCSTAAPGVFWSTSSQMLLYDIVGPGALASAVRLNATARYLGVLVGPGVGSVHHAHARADATASSSTRCSTCRCCSGWCARPTAGTSAARRRARSAPSAASPTSSQTIRDVREVPVVAAMILLAGAASFFVGNSYQAQMPGFAHDLGHGDPGRGLHVAARRRRGRRAARRASCSRRAAALLPTSPRIALQLAALLGRRARRLRARRTAIALALVAACSSPASSSSRSAAWRRRSCR